MDRLTFEGNFCEISLCVGEYRMCSWCENGACDARKVWERLKEYEDLEEQGRLIVLDEPMRPLVWGDKNHDTILCPRCLSDLMGGFQYAPSSEEKMYQCPHCGCPVDTTKATEMVED